MRPITPEEAAIVQWLLEHPGPGEPTGPWRQSPGELVVVRQCDCGCRSVDFSHSNDPAFPIRDAVAVLADGQRRGVMLFASGNEITRLDFDDTGGMDEPARLPRIEELRTWEMLGG